MSSKINLANLTFGIEEIRDFNELIRIDSLGAPDLNALHPIMTGIRNKQAIGYIGSDIGLIGKAKQGCGTQTSDNKEFPTSQKLWDLGRWEVLQNYCHTDFESNIGRFARELKTNVGDLTNTEIMRFIADLLAPNLTRALFRMAWFNDKDAANTDDSPSGVIKEGVDTGYFDLTNGIFRQLSDIITADAARKTAVSANDEATYDLQDSQFSNENAYDLLLKVIRDAPILLRNDPAAAIMVTDSVYVRLRDHLIGKSLDWELERTLNGMPIIRFRGYNVINMPMWDAQIRAYEDDGTKYNAPHRAVMTNRNNLPIGLEGNDLFPLTNIWYDPNTEYVKLRISDAIDSKVIRDDLVQYAV